MALPFTPQQRDEIRARLLESARRHAIDDGPQRTSMDTLTSEAGISKSSFYKFFDSKEALFLQVAMRWEQEILACATEALHASAGRSDKERASAVVFTAFECIHRLGIARFLREDVPYLSAFIPDENVRAHCLSSAHSIFDALRAAHIRFTAPDEIVLPVIELMYLSIMHMNEVGDSFFPALQTLVDCACARLVA